MWGSDCDSIQLRLALLVGNDLPRAEQEELQQHLAGCPTCHARWRTLRESQQWLEQARVASATPSRVGGREESVWAGVRRGLTAVDQQQTRGARNWRNWLPAGAVAAACLAVAVGIGELWLPNSDNSRLADSTRGTLMPRQSLLSTGNPGLPVSMRTGGATPDTDAEWRWKALPERPQRTQPSGPYRNY